MRKSLLLGASLALLLVACGETANVETTSSPQSTTAVSTAGVDDLPGGFELIETVTRSGDEIIIPYKKYRLPNGLTVILHEDDSDPLVHVDVTYEVGSGREDVGKSGFAHFFEHMMFQGSENVADEEHFKIISESGGRLNGTTNGDRTNYFETAPANQLEKMLWLEADRMGFLLDAVTQEKFEVQRETVKNERGQRVDNAPYGLLFERLGEALYPEGHPYSWSTIGYLEDLDRADLDDLKRFFLRWYGPNNAVLTIGGRLDERETLEKVAKYFGSIPRGPAVEDPVYTPVTLDADRYISLEDNVRLARLDVVWPTVHDRHPDQPALDVLVSILGQGRTSLLYKNLVKDRVSVRAGGFHRCRELSCELQLFSLANLSGDKSLADVDRIINASLAEFEERGVTDDDLTRVKSGIISGIIFSLESVSRKVSQLAAYETFANDAGYLAKDLEAYESVTKADVQRVYETYIKGKPSVRVSIVPKGQGAKIAHEDTWQRYERTLPDYPSADGLDLRDAVDNFDRSVQPASSNIDLSIKVPDIWRSELSNGIKILGAANTETPTTALQIRLELGQSNEPLDKLGIAAMTASMLQEATQNRSNEELSNALAKIGSQVNINSGDDFTIITVRSLSDKLDETLAIAMERLFEPAFNEADFTRVKSQTIQGIRNSKVQPAQTATAVYNKILYGADNAFAYPNTGTEETVSALTLDDVKAFYEANYTATLASVVAVSDLSETALKSKLSRLEEWAAKPVAKPVIKPFPEIAKNTLYLINKDGAAQSQIRIGKRALTFDATGEYYRAGLMNFILGGAFNSRINLNLREDKGYSYGARSRFTGTRVRGAYTASAGVRTDSSGASITEFLKEIRGYRESGIEADELAFTKNAIGQSDALDYETPFQKLGFVSTILTYDLNEDYVDVQNGILNDISADDINALASKHLDTDEMTIVIVGDKATILPDLEGLGFDIVELDSDGNPVQ